MITEQSTRQYCHTIVFRKKLAILFHPQLSQGEPLE